MLQRPQHSLFFPLLCRKNSAQACKDSLKPGNTRCACKWRKHGVWGKAAGAAQRQKCQFLLRRTDMETQPPRRNQDVSLEKPQNPSDSQLTPLRNAVTSMGIKWRILKEKMQSRVFKKSLTQNGHCWMGALHTSCLAQRPMTTQTASPGASLGP